MLSLDLVLAEGPAAIFKIAISLFQQYKDYIIKLDGFEAVADFIKNRINCPDEETSNEIFIRAAKIDLGTRLDVYGAEYVVLSEMDMIKEPGQCHWSPSKNLVKDLRIENRKLREQVCSLPFSTNVNFTSSAVDTRNTNPSTSRLSFRNSRASSATKRSSASCE